MNLAVRNPASPVDRVIEGEKCLLRLQPCRNTAASPVSFPPGGGKRNKSDFIRLTLANVFQEQTVRGRFTFRDPAIAAALFAADQSLAAVATAIQLLHGRRQQVLFTTGARFLIRSAARDTTSATIEDYLHVLRPGRRVSASQRAHVESYDTVTKGGYQDYYLTDGWLLNKGLDAIRRAVQLRQ